MEGIVVFDYADRYHLAIAEMAGYLKDGRIDKEHDPDGSKMRATFVANAKRYTDAGMVFVLQDVRGASLTFAYELRGPAGVLATGHTRLGCLDRDNRPVRLPTDTLDTLRRGIRPAAPPSEMP